MPTTLSIFIRINNNSLIYKQICVSVTTLEIAVCMGCNELLEETDKYDETLHTERTQHATIQINLLWFIRGHKAFPFASFGLTN